MPYIPLESRDRIDAGEPPRNPGELNYKLSSILISSKRFTYQSGERMMFLNREIRVAVDSYLAFETLSYQRLNDVVGAIVCAGHEFARRTGDTFARNVMSDHALRFYTTYAVPYEIRKMQENGDLPYVVRPIAEE